MRIVAVLIAATLATTVLAGCSSGSGSSETGTVTTNQDDAGGYNRNLRASSELIDGYPADINGVRYPGYVSAEMDAAYADCVVAADSISMSTFPGTNDYWMVAQDAWEYSSPVQYPKNGDTQYACYYGYLRVQQEFL